MHAAIVKARNLVVGPAPAPEDEPPEREAEAERAESERSDRGCLAPSRQSRPTRQRRLLVGRQRPPLALFAHGPAGADPEVEVVEDLGVRHKLSVYTRLAGPSTQLPVADLHVGAGQRPRLG